MDNHYLLICISGEYRTGKMEAYEACSGYCRGIIPLLILLPLFGIPLLIYSHHSFQVICEILTHPLWYTDPQYHSTIAIKNFGKYM